MSRIAINSVEGSGFRVGKKEKASLHPIHYSLYPEKGFTLLELLITIMIIAVILIVARSPDLERSNAKTSFKNTSQTLQTELSTLHNEALSLNTTTRMVLTLSGGVYNITTYSSSTPVTTCSSAGTWTQISSKPITVHSLYQITGTSAMANTCFYRDGSSSGGVFTISPITTSTFLKSAVITVTIATGYLDVATGYIDSGGVLNADVQ